MMKKTQKKLNIGWIKFTCSGDSSIMFLEMMNTKWKEWKDLLSIRFFHLLKGKNSLRNIDVLFVEGAISTKEEEKILKDVRKRCKRLVAIGSCAVYGNPSNQRNFFDEKTKKEIEPILKKFKHREKVSPISEIVKVDDIVPGCPMDENEFLRVLNKYLKEFGVVKDA
jgi:F420-non-reducing hydrogenase small subunit